MTGRPTCRPQGSSCKRQCTRRKCRRGGNRWGRKSACRQHPGFYGKKNTATYHPIRHVSRNPPWILGWYVRTHPGSKTRTVSHSNELKTSLPLSARLAGDVKAPWASHMLFDDLVDDPVFLSLLSDHYIIPLHVLLNALQ